LNKYSVIVGKKCLECGNYNPIKLCAEIGANGSGRCHRFRVKG
jgi:hypothetical protein